MGRLFGTDGIRGIANKELTCELAMKIGRAAATVLKYSDKKPLVIVGKDTRASSDMLENALAAGLCSVGANVVILGVVPTPAVAYLVSKYKADAGVMISASHNSCEFNGIKIFNGEGYKLADEIEERIEDLILDNSEKDLPIAGDVGKITYSQTAKNDYIEHLKSTTDTKLNGMKIVFDCSNGSASETAKTLFSELGMAATYINASPDGVNINEKCGSTHIDLLSKYVVENGFDAGFAFDGDADRCLAVDERGNLIDGDFIMAICTADMKSRGTLKKNTVVGTIMSNLGFIEFCKNNNIRFEATKVGDRYVLEEMILGGYSFGGEQSGHFIFSDYATTGDGQLTAIQVLSLLKRRNARLSSIATLMEKFPQTLVNLKISNDKKVKFFTDEVIKASIKNAETTLGETGRIIVRPSGTEPLIRVMVEGQNLSQIEEIANEVANVIKERLA